MLRRGLLSAVLLALPTLGWSAKRPSVDPCTLPIKPGQCLALIPRWGFSTERLQCVPFTYGGCNGNANSFQTLQECEAACMFRAPDHAIAIPLELHEKLVKQHSKAGRALSEGKRHSGRALQYYQKAQYYYKRYQQYTQPQRYEYGRPYQQYATQSMYPPNYYYPHIEYP